MRTVSARVAAAAAALVMAASGAATAFAVQHLDGTPTSLPTTAARVSPVAGGPADTVAAGAAADVGSIGTTAPGTEGRRLKHAVEESTTSSALVPSGRWSAGDGTGDVLAPYGAEAATRGVSVSVPEVTTRTTTAPAQAPGTPTIMPVVIQSGPIPTRTDEYGDPDAVILRAPDHDFGSGYHGNYGIYHRQTSPDADLTAAAESPHGCLIIGDSIATFVVKDLVAGLKESLGDTCVYDTWPGRATEGTANALLDIKRRHGLPQRIVVISGTNDIFNPPLFEAQMNRMLDTIGPSRQVLWLSTFDSRRPKSSLSAADERNTAWINSVLTARSTTTPNLSIVPWDSLFRGNAGNVDALLSDGVHPNQAGILAMVGMVQKSLS